MQIEIAAFKLGDEIYGIEVKKIREILTYQSPTKLPNTASCIKGVINIRGEVTPVLDLRIKFNITQTPQYSQTTPVIATKTGDGRMVGVVVDTIEGFEEVNLKEMIEIPELSLGVSREYLRGVFRKGEKVIIMLDTEKALSKDELER